MVRTARDNLLKSPDRLAAGSDADRVRLVLTGEIPKALDELVGAHTRASSKSARDARPLHFGWRMMSHFQIEATRRQSQGLQRGFSHMVSGDRDRAMLAVNCRNTLQRHGNIFRRD